MEGETNSPGQPSHLLSLENELELMVARMLFIKINRTSSEYWVNSDDYHH